MANHQPAESGKGNKSAVKNKKKKGRGGLIFLLILVLLVGGAAALLYFNVYNLRDMAFNALRNVPLVGSLIPETQAPEPGRFAGMTTDQLIARIESLEKQVETLQSGSDAQRTQINDQLREIERLREFEEAQAQFKQDQEEFQKMVYDEVPPAEFFKFFRQMNPDLAEQLAREAAGVVQNEKNVRSYLEIIRNTDEKTAARDLEILMDSDSTLVRDIMNGLPSDVAGAILNNMSAEKGAALIKLMMPDGFNQR